MPEVIDLISSDSEHDSSSPKRNPAPADDRNDRKDRLGLRSETGRSKGKERAEEVDVEPAIMGAASRNGVINILSGTNENKKRKNESDGEETSGKRLKADQAGTNKDNNASASSTEFTAPSTLSAVVSSSTTSRLSTEAITTSASPRPLTSPAVRSNTLFPATRGIYRQIYSKHHADTHNHTGLHNPFITLDQVLRPSSLKLAVLTSFQWDIPWLFPKFRPGTNVRLVMQPPEDRSRAGSSGRGRGRFGPRQSAEDKCRADAAARGRECGLNVTLSFCPMNEGARIMHAKLMLLKFSEPLASGGGGISLGDDNSVHSQPHRETEWLRIVISSANLVDYDWGEGRDSLDNGVFYIDLPKKETAGGDSDGTFELPSQSGPLPQSADATGLATTTDTTTTTTTTATAAGTTPFARELFYFCRALGLEENMVKSLDKYDFSNIRHLAFVHSIAGTSSVLCEGGRTGMFSLAAAVRELGLGNEVVHGEDEEDGDGHGEEAGKDRFVHYAASSLGCLTNDFLSLMYGALHGRDPVTTMTGTNPRLPVQRGPSSADQDFPSTSDSHSSLPVRRNRPFPLHISFLLSHFQVIYPSCETVVQSTSGAAGTICFQSRWYNREGFPRPCFRDHHSTPHPNLLSHNKIILVTGTEISDSGKPKSEPKSGAAQPGKKSTRSKSGQPFMYLGSHNLSESAWGRVAAHRAGTPLGPVSGEGEAPGHKISLANWECGVLFRVDLESEQDHSPSVQIPPAAQSRSSIPGGGLIHESIGSGTSKTQNDDSKNQSLFASVPDSGTVTTVFSTSALPTGGYRLGGDESTPVLLNPNGRPIPKRFLTYLSKGNAEKVEKERNGHEGANLSGDGDAPSEERPVVKGEEDLRKSTPQELDTTTATTAADARATRDGAATSSKEFVDGAILNNLPFKLPAPPMDPDGPWFSDLYD